MKNLLTHGGKLAVLILLALACAAYGQSLGAPAGEPHDLVRSSAALQRLEDELAQLRQSAGSTRSEMATLRHGIDEAQPWYLSPRMVQVLALLVPGAAAAALFAWRARRAAADAPWEPSSEAAPREPQAAATPAAAPVLPAPVPAFLTFHLPDTDDAPARARPAGSGLLRVETLAAILEEVEFLAALGLHADAMDVLGAYLEDSVSPAPVAFFELMRVCGLAGDPQAVDAVRRRYAKVHGAPAPTLAQVGVDGGLEQQRALADRVTRAWGTPGIVPVIEHALFDVPPPDAPLPVQAARELICLHAVAMVLAADGDEPGDPPLAPWAHAEHIGEAQAYAQAVGEDVGGHRFALDIDLSVGPAILSGKPPQPSAEELAARLLAEKEAAREAVERAAREAEEAFNAAVASERAPLNRY